jgi:hypothetical protein
MFGFVMYTISNAIMSKAQTASHETQESLDKGGRTSFFNYKKKNTLNNNNVRKQQSADSCSRVDVLMDTATKTAIEVLHDDDIHVNPHVRCGLQGIIPGRRNMVSIRTNGKKVSMSVVQARNEFKGQVKGQKKSPPELQSHTPPTSSFISNVSNRAYCNRLSNQAMDPRHEMMDVKSPTIARSRLSNEAMDPHHETMVRKSPSIAPVVTMMERVQKKMLHRFLDQSTTPATNRVEGRAHVQIAHNDAAFTSVIDMLQNVLCSQEISDTCLELQRAMD